MKKSKSTEKKNNLKIRLFYMDLSIEYNSQLYPVILYLFRYFSLSIVGRVDCVVIVFFGQSMLYARIIKIAYICKIFRWR